MQLESETNRGDWGDWGDWGCTCIPDEVDKPVPVCNLYRLHRCTAPDSQTPNQTDDEASMSKVESYATQYIKYDQINTRLRLGEGPGGGHVRSGYSS